MGALRFGLVELSLYGMAGFILVTQQHRTHNICDMSLDRQFTGMLIKIALDSTNRGIMKDRFNNVKLQ